MSPTASPSPSDRPASPQAETVDTVEERVAACVLAVRKASDLVPEVAVILGSGLGGVADRLPGTGFDTASLPHWPRATVSGHAGYLVLGRWGTAPVAVL